MAQDRSDVIQRLSEARWALGREFQEGEGYPEGLHLVVFNASDVALLEMAKPSASLRAPRAPLWLRITICALAGVGGIATLLLGLLLFDVRLTPDTGHGEDIGGFIVFAVAVPYLAISAFLGIGTGIGGLVISTGRARLAPAVGIVSTIVGIGFAMIPIRT